MSDCLFCKIVAGQIPATKVFENENVIAFVDIYPQAKIHLLFVHKDHTENVSEMSESPEDIAEVFTAIGKYTKEQGLDKKGFRVVTNSGTLAGQSVFHTHFHILSGEQLGRFGS